MVIRITQTKDFFRDVNKFIEKRALLREDYEELKKLLAQNPEAGDVVVGTNGIRKIRLKSASKGKSGGFRVCYYFYKPEEGILLILIYQKNAKTDLTEAEKKMLKKIVQGLKG